MLGRRQLVTVSALTLAVLSTLLLIAASPAQAQTETILWNFNALPDSSLIFDQEGNLYGATNSGGLGFGTVFELSPNGSGGWTESTLYSFCSVPNCADGARPSGSLIFDSEGNLYGTAGFGGNNQCGGVPQTGCGLVFELTPNGSTWQESVLYSFCPQSDCTTGAHPLTGVIFDAGGNLYGATATAPVVFKLSPSADGWTEQVLYDLGYVPGTAGLAIDATGNIFAVGNSAVFELSPNGTGGWNPTVIHTFTGPPSDGMNAEGTPVLDKAGNLYGTTYNGGSLCRDHGGCGTVYELSPGPSGWTEKLLHNFGAKNDGSLPSAGLVLDTAGNLFGLTVAGGEYNYGAVFELTAPVGKGSYAEKVLWNFNGGDGDNPLGGVILDNAGNLYGTTEYGGTQNGVAFEVTGVPATTTTTLTSSPNPSTYGEAVIFTAAVNSLYGALPNGETVSFMKGKTALGKGTLNDGSASVSISTLIVGTTSVTAVYGGDSMFVGSTSNAVKEVVKK